MALFFVFFTDKKVQKPLSALGLKGFLRNLLSLSFSLLDIYVSIRKIFISPSLLKLGRSLLSCVVKYIYSKDSAPIKKEPLIVPCFRCKKIIEIRFVPPLKAYSHKNSWEFWTNDKKNGGKYICSKCLKNLYVNRKSEFLKSIPDHKRRRVLRNYIANKIL